MLQFLIDFFSPRLFIANCRRIEKKSINFVILLNGFSIVSMNTFCADVDDVKFVINYDYPINSQDYIHRIGRTGRCSQTGTAFTFFTKKNSAKAADLIKVLTDSNQAINPQLYEMTGNRGYLNNKRGNISFILFVLI